MKKLWLLPIVLALGSSCWAALPVIDDTRVADVVVDGNKAIATAAIQQVMKLKVNGPLSRALVLADIDAIEALYKKAGKQVQIWPDLTHPGENQGTPRTTMTFRIIEGAPPRHYDENADPLENYYGNTLVCAAAQTGNDLCHMWLNRDGTFINFDSGEAKTGHYSIGPVRPDGKVAVCQYWDSATMVSPAEVSPPRGGGPPPAAAGAARAAGPPGGPPGGGPPAAGGPPGVVGATTQICDNVNHRTVCLRNVPVASLTEAEKKLTSGGMGERFYKGNCYPTGPHDVGDVWFEGDDPFPGQLGKDKVFLIRGRQ
jgi:hypothetical protein